MIPAISLDGGSSSGPYGVSTSLHGVSVNAVISASAATDAANADAVDTDCHCRCTPSPEGCSVGLAEGGTATEADRCNSEGVGW